MPYPKEIGDETTWIDVSSLFPSEANFSGIPRSTSGLLMGLRTIQPNHKVRFCLFLKKEKVFVEVSETEVDEKLRERMIFRLEAPRSQTGPLRKFAREILAFLPSDFSYSCSMVVQGLIGLLKSTFVLASRVFRKRKTHSIRSLRGTIYLISGFSQGKAKLLQSIKCEEQLRVVTLLFDILPTILPQFFPPGVEEAFTNELVSSAKVTDEFFAISHNTKKDCEKLMAIGLIEKKPIRVVRLGDVNPLGDRLEVQLPFCNLKPGEFILFLSTIEIRKNHRLIAQVWRRLTETNASYLRPLVIVGREGWMVQDLIAELAADPMLKPWVHRLGNISDGQVEWLYQNCRFSVFPSIYEGWGLPVAESLSRGKYCIASNASSIPEIGGNLIDYHDPYDFTACFNLVSRALKDDEYLRSREQKIRSEYHSQKWSDTSADLFRIRTRRDVSKIA